MEKRAHQNNISIVVILYYPDAETLSFVEGLVDAGLQLIAVVNAADSSSLARLREKTALHLVENLENVGLAKALNQGCKLAFQKNATHVMLLDQDSRPTPSMPSELLADFVALETAGKRMAAVGPRLVDIKGTGKLRSAQCPIEQDIEAYTSVDTLATSGCLFSRSAFETVGEMYEWLFIDDIDHEWCFRASHKQLEVIRSNRREMIHNMGDGGVTLLGRYRPLHRSPIRHYYITRNTIYLCKQPYVRFGWRITEAIKLSYRIPIYLLISTNRISSLKNIIFGIIQGFKHKRHFRFESMING